MGNDIGVPFNEGHYRWTYGEGENMVLEKNILSPFNIYNILLIIIHNKTVICQEKMIHRIEDGLVVALLAFFKKNGH